MSKETTEIIKYKFEVEDSLFLSKMNSIQTSLKGTDDIALNLQKSFNGFSSSKMTVEMEKVTKKISETKKNVSDSISTFEKYSLGLEGISGAIEGLSGTAKAMEDINNKGLDMANGMELASSSLNTVSSCASIGTAILPGWGTAIGAAAGGIAALVTISASCKSVEEERAEAMIAASQAAIEASRESMKYSQTLLDEHDAITQSLSKELSLIDNHQDLLTELKSLTDENGNVKKGYEDRAQFIVSILNNAYGTEIKLIDGVIQNYQKEVKSIEDVIAKKRQEMVLQSAEKQYQLAMEKKVETYQHLQNAQKHFNEENEKYLAKKAELEKQYEEKGLFSQGISLNDYLKEMIEKDKVFREATYSMGIAKNAMNEAQNAYDANSEAMMNYQGLSAAIASEDAEAVDYYTNKVSNSYYDGKNMIGLTYTEMLNDAQLYHDSVYRNAEENGQKVTAAMEQEANSRYESVKKSLVNQSQALDTMTPDIVSAWCHLASTSSDQFLDFFEEIPEGLRQNVIDKMQEQGYEISDELQKGISKIDPNVKIKTDKSGVDANIVVTADTKQANLDIERVVKTISLKFQNPFQLITNYAECGGIYANGSWSSIPQYANGGLPNHGTMFIAGERGAEIVGHINGRTEVLNKSQIASAIYTAVATAMREYSGTNQDIRVYAEEGLIVEKVSKGINQHIKQTGSLPFVIPI